MVVTDPPMVAVLALSAAARPSSEPCPNFSGCLEARLACAQAMTPAMSPPAAGTTPTTAPTPVPMAEGLSSSRCCARVGHHAPSWVMGTGLFFLRLSASWLKSSAIPNRPMIAAMNGMPELSSENPKVKRVSPVMGSRPTVPSNRPAAPATRPLRTLLPETPTIMVRPNTTSANISAGPNRRATDARGWAASTRMRMPANEPAAETSAELVSAMPALPCFASGYPSKVEAMEAGVPGVFTRMAGTRSPNWAAT